MPWKLEDLKKYENPNQWTVEDLKPKFNTQPDVKTTTPTFESTKSPNFIDNTSLRNETWLDKAGNFLRKVNNTLQLPLSAIEKGAILPQLVKYPGRIQQEEENLAKHPIINTVGTIAGSILPGSLIESAAVKALPSIFGGLKVATKTGEHVVVEGIKGATKLAARGIAGAGGYGVAEGLTEGIKNNMGIGGTLQNMGNKAYDYSLGAGILAPALGKIGSSINTYKTSQGLKNIDDAMAKYSSEGLTARPNLNIIPKNSSFSQNMINKFSNTNNAPMESNLKPVNLDSGMNLPTRVNKPLEVPLNSNNSNMPKYNFEHIKTVEDLPNDVPTLEAYVKEMQDKQDSGYQLLDINLQLFAEAKKRLASLSKVYTNTFEKTDMFNQAEKDILNSSFTNDAKSNVKSELESLENAKKRLANNYDGEVKDLLNKELYSGEDVDTLFGILEQEKMKARQTGDYTKVREIASKGVKEAGREGGRTVQAFAKYSRTAEGKIIEAQRTVDNFADDVMKQNPKIKNEVDATTKKAKKIKEDIKKETDKVIDEAVNEQVTHFPKMLQDRISKALNPKTPEEKGFIKTMLDDLFGEAKENIPFPKAPKLPDNSISRLANSYKYREYYGLVRTKAQELLQKEFADSPEALAILDNYFNKGFKPPHSQKLLNDILNKRLGGLNAPNKTGTVSNKPNLSTWVKDWYASGRAAKEDFVDSIIRETGLSGDEAQSLKNLLDSKLHTATKQMKDRLLETVMAPKKISALKSAATKLSELTNIGLTENTKFTNRISEKISPVIKQLMRENNINMNEIVRLSQQDKQNALAILKRDVFKNARVDDKEIVKLLDLVDSEFKSLTKQTQERIFNNLLKERGLNAPKTMVEKLREKINLGLYGDDVDSAIQDAIRQKYNLPTLSDDEVKFITETMDSVKGLPERSEAYLEAMAKVEKLILEKTPASLSQKVGAGGFISMLGNFTSPLINASGNALLSIPELASNPLRRVIDKGISKGFNTGNLTVGKSDVNTLLQGAKQGARSVKRDFLGGRDFKDLKGKSAKEISDVLANPINTDTSMTNYGDKFEVGNRLAFDNKLGRTLENIVGTNMKIGDIPFNKAYFEDTLQQLMKANNVTEPTEDMLKTAFQVSQERTFKDDNLLSTSAVALKNLPKMIQQRIGFKPEAQKGLKGVAAELPQIISNSIIPFARTPANLIKRGAEYSPLGIVEGLGKLATNKGNLSMMEQREIVDRLTRGITGTGMLGLGTLAYKKGLITDSRDENYNTEKLKQQEGILPDALKVGGKTFDLKKLQPFTTPIIAGARLMQGKGGDTLSSIAGGIEGALTQYSDMSMLQSLAKASQLLASSDSINPPDKTKILLDIAMTLPKQYTPSILKKLTYALDPFERDLGSDNAGKYALNSVIGKLPGISKSFPAKTDVYGNPIQSYDGNNSLANTMFNPYLSKSLKNNPISNEALRLNKANIDGDMKNQVIPKEVSKDLGNVKLTTEQQNQYQKLMGDKVQAKINNMLANQKYKDMDDNNKAIAFSHALDLAREEAKTEMLKSLGVNPTEDKKKQLLESTNKSKVYGQLGLFKKY